MKALTVDEIEFLLESLKYTKLNFEGTTYPSYEFKQAQIKRVENVQAKLRDMKAEMAG